jgi:ankyrin repeat protein
MVFDGFPFMVNGVVHALMQVVQFLLSCGFSVHCKNEDGETPLHTAAIKVRLETRDWRLETRD